MALVGGYRLRIALNIKGLAYRRVAVNLARGEQHAAAHLARDPLGRVPVLSLAGRTLTQSFAMLEYLEEAYPTPPLLPADAPARARVRALSLVVVADIHPIGNSGTMAHVDTLFPLDKNAWQAHFIGQGFAAVEAILAAAPASKFCHGDTPGIADCCLIPQIYNANRWGVSLTSIPKNPRHQRRRKYPTGIPKRAPG